MRELPTGIVTLVFTDIEGSTRMLSEIGAEAYAEALAEHRRLLRGAYGRHGGVEVDTQGDAFFYAFPSATAAVEAAREGQAALRQGPVRVRVGIHTGTPHVTDEGYVGHDVHLGARVGAVAHGGQVILTKSTADLVDVTSKDLGEHRVKDFSEPVWLFQLGREAFPPLKTISNTNLPRPAAAFIGRDSEVGRVTQLLRTDDRIVTLLGPGGTGKTRLAIEAASEMIPEFRNGVFWIGLAQLRDPSVVIDTIAQTIGARDDLVDHIGAREMLLLIDNLEQVIDAAPALAELVTSCPELRLLVTSREPLRVAGEIGFAVPPLAGTDAVDLFCARSGLTPDDTIAELCRRLDNMPLAVELAAARTSVLSPAQILERLGKRLDLLKGGRDADPRQATLRATIQWSYDLLPETEKEAFARFSVLSGATLDAAEVVADADLDTLQALVDKSLVRFTEERYWMFETIRAYAAERLEESGLDHETRDRHAAYFLEVAESASAAIHIEIGREGWPDLLEAEHDNLRAALEHTNGDAELQLRFTGALRDFWAERGHISEGLRNLKRALALPGGTPLARARALAGANLLASQSNDLAGAARWGEEGLSLFREIGDARGTAIALQGLGYATGELGNLRKAIELLEEAIALFEDVGDERFLLWTTRTLAWMNIQSGHRDEGRRLHEANVERAREMGDPQLEAITLGTLSGLAVEDGMVEEALSLLERSARLYAEDADPVSAGVHVCRAAYVFARADSPEVAARLLGCGQRILEELGAKERWVVGMNERTAAAVRSNLDEASFERERDAGRSLMIEDASDLVLATIEGMRREISRGAP